MSKGNPQAGGSTSGFGSQGQFGTGYTQPYGAPGTGTYDPMLGFGQASGMGTTFNYPTRYSADYSRYAQSGMPFNQPVMGYNTYGQIFAQPQRPPPTMGKGGGGFRPQPPPIMGGGKGGGGFQPGYGYQPQFPGMMAGGPGFPQQFPRRPERRTNQLGLNQPPPQNLNDVPEPGPKGLPSPLVPRRSTVEQILPDQNIANSPFGQLIGQPAVQPSGPAMAQQGTIISNPDRDRAREINMRSFNNPGSITSEDMAFLQEYDARSSNPADLQAQLAAQRQMAAGNTFGLGGMPQQTVDPYQGSYNISTIPYQGGPVAAQQGANISNPAGNTFDLNRMPIGRPQRNFDTQGFDLSPQTFNFGQDFGRMYFQEGGQVPPDAASNMEVMLSEAGPANPQSEMAGEYDRLIQMTMQAVLGQTENADEIIQMFIDEFGVDAFRQLRDAVLKQQVPNAQTEGMVDGNGGGMDDQVMGMIGNQRPVAVSPGEYIVPADVVSGLGDGSSKSGADILDELNQAVRMARTGTPEQPRPLMETLQQ